MDKQVFWLSVIALVIGLVVIAVIFWFGRKLAPWDWNRLPLPADTQVAHDLITDYRARRNEFWISFCQIALSIFVVVILFVLLLTGTISAEAGLPILSGMSGYAIAKGVSVGRTGRSAAPG